MYLIIVDGFGLANINSEAQRNAIAEARTPNIDELLEENPSAKLRCHGQYVGMPEKTAGNSEVGHLTIGCGKRVDTPYRKVNRLFEQGRFEERISEFLEETKVIHLIGLCSDGGVHSDIQHLKGLSQIIKKNNSEPVVHFVVDGRDVPPNSAIKFAKEIENEGISISSVTGRHYAMDRDNNFDRTKKALKALIGRTENTYQSFKGIIQDARRNGVQDQYIEPSNVLNVPNIGSGSKVFMFNFRNDRMKQLSKMLLENVKCEVLTMTKYLDTNTLSHVIDREEVDLTMHDILELNEYNQYRIAESEKKPHVTWFFDGQRSPDLSDVNLSILDSSSVERYNKNPAMKAEEITDEILRVEDKEDNDFFCLVNYANLDLVGHTGKYEATVESVEYIDGEIGRIRENINSPFILTSDHGNAEDMGSISRPNRSHTINRVPIVLGNTGVEINDGELRDVVPTITKLLGLDTDKEIEGESIIH